MSDPAPSLWLLAAIERPRCILCRTRMNVVPREPHRDGAEKRAFECQRCSFMMTKIVGDPPDSPALSALKQPQATGVNAVHTRSRKSAWTEKDNERLRAMIASGATPVRAAAAFGRTMTSVRAHARKIGRPFLSIRIPENGETSKPPGPGTK
jgi:hypothetical protein